MKYRAGQYQLRAMPFPDADPSKATAKETDKTANNEITLVSINSDIATPFAPSAEVEVSRRRSGRIASKVGQLEPVKGDWLAAEEARSAARKAEKERRVAELDQVALVRAGVNGVPPPPYRTVIHPCATALLQLHSHFARTEIIGYLAGLVCKRDGNGDAGPAKTVFILEAFPVMNISARALAKEGRSASNEVEMDPESACEVQMRVLEKGLSVVGWYHSHPFFSSLPSDIDVQNQLNQQTLLFHEAPYIAAICSPFWEELPDARSKLDMFYIHTGDAAVPVEIDYSSSYDLPARGTPGTEPFFAALSDSGHEVGGSSVKGIHSNGGGSNGIFDREDQGISLEDSAVVQSLQRSSLENEAVSIISTYSSFPRRTNLHGEWRPQVTMLRKLQRSLKAVVSLSANVHVTEAEPWEESSPVGAKEAKKVSAIDCCETGGDMRGSGMGGKPLATLGNVPDAKSADSNSTLRRNEPISACAQEQKVGLSADTHDSEAENGWNRDQRSLWTVLQNVISLASESWAAASRERGERAKAAANRKKRKTRP